MSRARQKDIALRLGLSISTVSKALSDSHLINKETREMVKVIAEKMGYRPNKLAQGFKKNVSRTIGVILPKLEYFLYAKCLSGIESEADKMGYKLIICQSNENHDKEVNFVNDLLDHRIAGFIISVASNTKTHEHFRQIIRSECPVVFFNRECSEIEAPKVIIDNYSASYNATENLIKKGMRKIAFLAAVPRVEISNKRISGYKDALIMNEITFTKDMIVHAEFNPQEVYEKVTQLLKRQEVDAMICYSDQLAISAIKAIKGLNKKIPEDVRIIGFNNEPADEIMCPSLSSIDQPAEEMGRVAFRLLFNQDRTKRVVLNSLLIERESSK